MTDIAPPAYAEWWDTADTVAAVFAILRLSDGDVDQARIEALIPAAGANISAFLDDVEEVDGDEPWARAALEMETVALYRAQTLDVDPYVSLGGAARGRTALAGGPAVASLLAPHRARRGVA